MAFCKKCGAQLDENAKICPNCAEKVQSFNFEEMAKSLLKTNDYTDAYARSDINDNKVFAILSYIPLICLVPFFVQAKKSSFVKFHANQGILLFILDFIIGIVSGLLALIGMIPFVGIVFAILGGIVFGIIGLAILAAQIYGIVNAATGKAIELPLIGKIKLF